MKRNYYLVVELSNKITSKDIRKKIMNSQYFTSKTYAHKHYTDTKTIQTVNKRAKTTTELWYVTEYTDKATIQVIKSTSNKGIDKGLSLYI